MARRVDYDAPSCRQQAQRAQQQLADLEKRTADSLKSASAAAAEYKQASWGGGKAERAAPCCQACCRSYC
jgi:hypothetical protein